MSFRSFLTLFDRSNPFSARVSSRSIPRKIFSFVILVAGPRLGQTTSGRCCVYQRTDDRFTPISGPYLKLIDWPKSANSGREQMQQNAGTQAPM
jgi:hypothetical protein